MAARKNTAGSKPATFNRDLKAYNFKTRGRKGKAEKTVERMATVTALRGDNSDGFAIHMPTDFPGLSAASVKSLIRNMAKAAGEKVSIGTDESDPNVLGVKFHKGTK